MRACVNQSVECNVAVTNQHVLYLANEGKGCHEGYVKCDVQYVCIC
jgi:hypothetical protein